MHPQTSEFLNTISSKDTLSADEFRRATREAPTHTDRFYVVFMTLLHLGAIGALFFFSWANLFSAVVLYTISGLGITVGYHRLLTHRSFKTPKWLERLWAFFGTLAIEGGPVTWVGQHRHHHAESDSDFEPHNVRQGFWWAHFFWIFKRYPQWYQQAQKKRFAPDLMKDPVLLWLDRYYYVPSIFLTVGLLAWGGVGAFLWGFCLRAVLMYHATWLVNSAAHIWGYRFWPEELATNNWWVALVSFGEGWHNTHHKHPTSARHGLRAWEIDPSWILIWTMARLGLAKNIKLPATHELPWKQGVSV